MINFARFLVISFAAAGSLPAATIPEWAYPVPPPVSPSAPAAPTESLERHVPNSTVTLTARDLEAHQPSVADWHPQDHPVMPTIVTRGREPQVWACAYCHLPNGAGRPENASLAGLSPGYIKQQLAAFKQGDRPGAERRRAPQNFMIALAKALTESEIDEAAAYFSALKPASFIKVIETATVPKTFVAGAMLAKSPGGDTEPLGDRIIEVPVDLERAENRDARTPYVAYAPIGSIARGAALVLKDSGGKTVVCATCHGPGLNGLGDVPRLAGRSPSYLLRQLYDVQVGARTGTTIQMQPVVAKLSPRDLVDIVAYLSSRKP